MKTKYFFTRLAIIAGLWAVGQSAQAQIIVTPDRDKIIHVQNEGPLRWVADGNGFRLEASGEPYSSTVAKIVFSPPAGTVRLVVTFTVSGMDGNKATLYGLAISAIRDGTYTQTLGSNYGDYYLAARVYSAEALQSLPDIRISDVKTQLFSPAILSLNHLYDVNGDGRKELFEFLDTNNSDDSRYLLSYRYDVANSAFVFRDTVLQGAVIRNLTDVFNVNNDDKPEFCAEFYDDIRKSNYNGIYLSSPSGYTSMKNVAAARWDVNADGRPDLYFSKTSDGSATLDEPERYIYYQQADGSFLKSRIEFLSNQEYLDVVKEHVRRNTSDRFQMFADVPVVGIPPLANLNAETDFNKDGLPDLLSDNGVLLNMGNNRFAYAQVPGNIFAKDLNGDFLPDMILYDEDAQTVTSRIYLGNGEVKEQVLLRNRKISDVWCYDFDRDGDVDVLIPLNYQTATGYAFLIFCENQGQGKFKIHENYYEDKWIFVKCADVNSDGYYDLIALKVNSTNYYDKIKGDCYLFAGKTGLAFNEPAFLLTDPNEYRWSPDADPVYYFSHLPYFLQDFDGDGVYELAINLGDYNSTYSSFNSSYIYNFENIPVNQAPAKPTAPTIALNRETGQLKISWSTGSDAETSAVDLTYSLRIGSAPGKSDVWHPGANANGSRITFTPGNMGSDLEKTVDVSGWQPGNYYIAIQTVDPMYRGSAFSGEVVYTHEVVTPKFTLSDSRLFAVDTLTISLAGAKPAGYTYNWTIPDGQIIEENDYSLKAVFSQAGEKTISLQLTGAGNETLPAYEQQVTVLPNKLVKNTEAMFNFYPILDLDGNGTIDGYMYSGNLYSNNGQGVFTKIPKLYNSDLIFQSSGCTMDVNLDGLPDMIARTNNGGILLNGDNLSFEVLNEQLSAQNGRHLEPESSKIYDFNNDGYADAQIGGFYKNTGDNRTFEQLSYGLGYTDFVYDLNRDGLWDLITVNNPYPYDTYTLKEWINKGNFVFEAQEQETDLSFLLNNSARIHAIRDMNNDGYPDLILEKEDERIFPRPNSNSYAISTYFIAYGNSENQYEEPVTLFSGGGSFVDIQDFDNNGFPDIMMHSLHYKIAYFYPDSEVRLIPSVSPYEISVYNDIYNDLNGDSIPDFDVSVYHQTRIANTPPQAPANIRARQTATGLLIEWDAAQDAETPYVQMRYNVSVKKKNAAVGDENAFIISPLNGLKDAAAVVPKLPYRTATRMEIPLSRFEAGTEYEIQVQSIDLWNAHSPMSAPLTFADLGGIAVQEEACTETLVDVEYRGTETGAPVWDMDGGTIVTHVSDKKKTVRWATSGVKTITATVGGKTATAFIKINAARDLSFTLPATALAETAIGFELPELVLLPETEYLFRTSSSEISIRRREGTREATVTFPHREDNPSQWIEIVVHDTICGEQSYRQTVEVKAGIATPKISLVNIDPVTGKNKIIWDKTNVNLTPDVTEMLIYREGSRYNQFSPIGSISPAAGEFVDLTSNPQIVTSRYRIAYNTVYGAQSNASVPHRSTHLMLNRGMGASINLCWTSYEGGIIESYRIYRGATPETMTLLVEVPGSTNAYTDMTPPDGLFYYAIEYDQTYNPEWIIESTLPLSSAFRASQAATQWITGRSNAVSVVNAQNITMAQQLHILVLEATAALSPAQPELHLYAEIFPVTADYRVVNWQITSGEAYAYITPQGTLAATGNRQGGTVTVRATTIDGSNVTATRSFAVEAYGETGIVLPEAERPTTFTVYPNPVSDGFRIGGVREPATLTLINVNGAVVLSQAVSDGEYVSVSSLAKGLYIVKLQTGNGTLEKKLIKM